MFSILEEDARKNVKVILVTRPAEDYADDKIPVITNILETLENGNITIKCQSKIHQKFSVIDPRIVWYGNINLLSYGCSEESMMRIESGHIAGELIKTF